MTTAWINKFKAIKKYHEVSIKVAARFWSFKAWVNFLEIPLVVTLLLINFVMIPANGLDMENIFF